MKSKTPKKHQFTINPLIRIYIIIFFTLFALLLGWCIFNIRAIDFILIVVGLLSIEFFMLIVETFLHYKQILDFLKKHIKLKKTPKIFEYIFFLCLFFAALASTFSAAGFYIQGIGSDVFLNFWWLVIFYGFAIASGIYHYILRIDE